MVEALALEEQKETETKEDEKEVFERSFKIRDDVKGKLLGFMKGRKIRDMNEAIKILLDEREKTKKDPIERSKDADKILKDIEDEKRKKFADDVDYTTGLVEKLTASVQALENFHKTMETNKELFDYISGRKDKMNKEKENEKIERFNRLVELVGFDKAVRIMSEGDEGGYRGYFSRAEEEARTRRMIELMTHASEIKTIQNMLKDDSSGDYLWKTVIPILLITNKGDLNPVLQALITKDKDYAKEIAERIDKIREEQFNTALKSQEDIRKIIETYQKDKTEEAKRRYEEEMKKLEKENEKIKEQYDREIETLHAHIARLEENIKHNAPRGDFISEFEKAIGTVERIQNLAERLRGITSLTGKSPSEMGLKDVGIDFGKRLLDLLGKKFEAEKLKAEATLEELRRKKGEYGSETEEIIPPSRARKQKTEERIQESIPEESQSEEESQISEESQIVEEESQSEEEGKIQEETNEERLKRIRKADI